MASGGRGGWLAGFGPGLLVAATGVGAGDLLTAGLAGSELGVVVLWTPLVGAALKWVLNEGLARWQLATGTTLLEGWNTHLGRPFRWLFGAYLVLWAFVVGGALISACGVAGAALLPLGDDETSRVVWGVAHSLLGLLLVRRGGFARFEQAMSISIALLFLTVTATAVALLVLGPRADLAATLSGMLRPSIPDDPRAAYWVLGVLGGVGGTVTLLSYGYWIREHDRRGDEGLATCRRDLAACYALTGFFGVAMIVIGSQVTLTGSGSRVALELGDRLGEVAGPVARGVFLFGFWAAVFSSLVGVWQGVPYLFADFLSRGGSGDPRPDGEGVTTASPVYRRVQWALALAPLPLLLGTVRTVQLVYTVLGALFMPLLAATLLVLNNRAALVGRHRNGALTNALLVATLALFVVVGWDELADTFG